MDTSDVSLTHRVARGLVSRPVAMGYISHTDVNLKTKT